MMSSVLSCLHGSRTQSIIVRIISIRFSLTTVSLPCQTALASEMKQTVTFHHGPLKIDLELTQHTYDIALLQLANSPPMLPPLWSLPPVAPFH